MAVLRETLSGYKTRLVLMTDEELIDQYIRVLQSGYNFEKDEARNQILWRMGYGRGGVK